MRILTKRRQILRASLGAGVLAASGVGFAGVASTDVPRPPSGEASRWGTILHPRLKKLNIPPLFVTAYITPSEPGQAGQEALVARYPLALVPQDARREFYAWRDKVKRINPDILLLAYHMVNEETTVPGPGHERYRTLTDPFVRYPGGVVPTVGPATKLRRLFDMRKPEWRAAFLQGCSDVMRSYPYDGLYLDNCTVFMAHHPSPWVRDELRDALQQTLLDLRDRHPDAIIIGNGRPNWRGLNGELVEGRSRDIEKEAASFTGHAKPEMDLVTTRLRCAADTTTLRRDMNLALRSGALYGASVTYQHVLWFDEFNEVIAAYRNA